MKIKLVLNIFLFTVLTWFNPMHADGVESIQVREMSDDGIVIEFFNDDWSVDTVSYGSTRYMRLDFSDAVYNTQAGEPLLPEKRTIIGIPLNAEISYRVEQMDSYEMTGRILPRSTPLMKDNFQAYEYTENDSLYRLDRITPGDLVSIGDPEYLRNQRILTVTFHPVQYNPAQNRIRIFKKIVVRITFEGVSGRERLSTASAGEDAFVKALVLNYAQSAKWQKARQPGSLKKTKTIQNAHKIFIKDEGMYKISGGTLLSYGIDIKAIDPATLKIYNNGGRELSRNILSSPPDSLIENAIVVQDGGDGVFDVSDYIIFYGKSVNNWEYDEDSDEYSHYINHFDEHNIYWMGWGDGVPGKRIRERDGTDDPALTPEAYFVDHYFFEQDVNNFLGSGYEWFSRLFIPGDEYGFTVNLTNVNPEAAAFRFRFIGWESSQHTYAITVNGKSLGNFASYGKGQYIVSQSADGLLTSGYNSVKVKYTGSRETSQAYLDWFEIDYRKKYIAEDNQLIFYPAASDSQKRFSVTGFEENDISIYDITDYMNVSQIAKASIANNEARFVERTYPHSAKRYIALTPSAFKSPDGVEPVTLAGLRNTSNGAEYIVITHDDFYESVLTYASHRENRDNMSTRVVKISDIYNEFSWGLIDPGAIRDFIKHAFHNWSVPPFYVLLWGDGDYDYKNVISEQDKNWIPTYQTSDLNEYDSRTIEDWFVFVSGTDTRADLAIGRIPVRSAEQSQIVVNKIIEYETANYTSESTENRIDDWRNIITMVGDDELIEGGVGEEDIHTRDAERIIESNRYVPNRFNKRKIYLTEYPALRNASYFSALLKPLASDAIIDQINKGTLILNYVGHGNPTTWSHEYVLYSPRDFEKIQNGNKYSFWVAATCDFGRFDDPNEQGMAEELIVAENRGAIGVLASTRVAYAQNNAALNRSFYLSLFDEERPTERLGLALLKAKIDNGSGTNDQKYVLLGDPTMRLAAPEYDAKITSITPDTIKALSRITVKGAVRKDAATWSDFNGKVLVKAYDSKKDRDYRTNADKLIAYKLPGNTIFRGTGEVQNGQFELSFIVPKDITYGGDLGRVNAYFVNEEVSGAGYLDSLRVGGTSEIVDEDGPEIRIGFQGQDFYDQGFANEKPVLKIDISDSLSGINIVGEIGHNITMILNDNEDDKIVLTDFFQYDENSYTSGSILYDLTDHFNGDLEQGTYHVSIKAWDNSNNSSTAETEFNVVSSTTLRLRNVLNYPNPFTSRTTFTFLASQSCICTVKIYTVAGRLIHEIEDIPLQANELAQVEWDGRDQDGDALANGVYFYKVTAKSDANGTSMSDEKIQKLVIVR